MCLVARCIFQPTKHTKGDKTTKNASSTSLVCILALTIYTYIVMKSIVTECFQPTVGAITYVVLVVSVLCR